MLIFLLLLVLLIILLLAYTSPKAPLNMPKTIKEAKRYGAFIREYKVDNYIVIDSAYQNVKLDSVFLTKQLYVKGNILGMRSFLGIVFYAPCNSNEKYFRFTINDNDKLNSKNFLQTWVIESKNQRSRAGQDTRKMYVEFDYSCTEEESIEYTIYIMKKSYGYSEENLIPVLKFKLVPKE